MNIEYLLALSSPNYESSSLVSQVEVRFHKGELLHGLVLELGNVAHGSVARPTVSSVLFIDSSDIDCSAMLNVIG